MSLFSTFRLVGGRIVPGSGIKAAAIVRYPASVQAQNGITATVSGGAATIGNDLGSLAITGTIGTSELATYYVMVWDSVNNTYKRVPAGTMGAGSTGTVTLPISLVTQVSGTLQAANFPALTGDVTTTVGSLASTIAANAVTAAKFRQSVALSLVGNPLSSTANVSDISATASSDAVLRESGGAIGFGTVATAGLANNAVSNAKLRQGTSFSVIGNALSGTANVADISATAAHQILRVNAAGASLGFGSISLATSASVSGTLVASAFPALLGDVTTSAGSLTTTIASNAIQNTQLRQGQALSVIGNYTSATANVADISGTLNQVLRVNDAGTGLGFGAISLATSASVSGTLLATSAPGLLGDVTSSGGSVTTTIANNAVTYAKMQDVSATSRIIARKTAGSGDPEECTLSEILDFIGAAAQGDIIYRGAATWTRLAAGTTGQFLKTNGGGSNPEWASPAGSGDMVSTQNLNDVANKTTATFNLGLMGAASQPLNVAISASAASSALTISIKNLSGADPSASSPLAIPFPSAGTLGIPSVLSVTSALSYTITSGSILGLPSSCSFRLWVCGFNASGTPAIGVFQSVKALTSAISTTGDVQVTPLMPHGLASAISGTATSAGTIYAASTITQQPMRILGYLEWNTSGTTAGSWTTSNLAVSRAFGPGVPRPGEVIAVNHNVTNTISFSTTSGVDVFTGQAITTTLNSPANIVAVTAYASAFASSTADALMTLYRNSAATIFVMANFRGNPNVCAWTHLRVLDRPNNMSASYQMYLRNSVNDGTTVFYPFPIASASSAGMITEEIFA